MAKFLTAGLIALAVTSVCVAQSGASSPTSPAVQSAQTQSPAATQTTILRMAPGSVIPVELTSTVDAKKEKSGEQVTAKVTQDLKASNGTMLMPRNTEIVGHVTQAQARTKQDKESEVAIVFDRAVTSSGNISYPMSIQAIISPLVFRNPNANNGGGAGAPEAPSAAQTSTPGGAGGAGEMGHGMGGGQAAPTNVPSGETGPATSGGNQPPAITSHTQGVVGFSHLELSTPSDPMQASVISSEKNNVKLENGTLMLLRINP